MAKRSRPDVPKGTGKGQREAAASLAIAALGFIAAEPERLGRFLALSGIGPETIRTAAQDPGFLIGVLDHLCSDDTLLIAFAEQNEIDPEEVIRAREALAGPGWDREAP
jgi:hypothetical protein